MCVSNINKSRAAFKTSLSSCFDCQSMLKLATKLAIQSRFERHQNFFIFKIIYGYYAAMCHTLQNVVQHQTMHFNSMKFVCSVYTWYIDQLKRRFFLNIYTIYIFMSIVFLVHVQILAVGLTYARSIICALRFHEIEVMFQRRKTISNLTHLVAI